MWQISQAVYKTQQIRELEAHARERFGISGVILMQRAGKAALDCLLHHWPHAKRLLVLCGGGNNGGDGYVLAQLAMQRGLKVHVRYVGDVQQLEGEALAAYESCKTAGVAIHPYQNADNFHHCDVIVDALCGIGLQQTIQNEWVSIIDAMNQSAIPIFSLDVPSGIDASTGSVCGIAVKATATITFIGLKLGLLTGQGVSYAGQLYCDDLQLPIDLYETVSAEASILSRNQFSHYFQPRPKDWHKGNSGHVLIVGGDEGYAGAPRMAGEAALRVGAGLVSIATHPSHAATLNLSRPELMCHGIQSKDQLQNLVGKADAIVLGPGLGQSDWSRNMFSFILEQVQPLIVDADGLNLLAEKPRKRTDWILTPHPGEAARLAKQTIETIQADRLTAIQNLRKQYDGVVVLKGAGSLVSDASSLPALCNKGNSGMATAGMGDVLSGVIGALVASGMPLADAAKMGVYLHAAAGDLAATEGARGMVALDLMPFLRKLMNE